MRKLSAFSGIYLVHWDTKVNSFFYLLGLYQQEQVNTPTRYKGDKANRAWLLTPIQHSEQIKRVSNQNSSILSSFEWQIFQCPVKGKGKAHKGMVVCPRSHTKWVAEVRWVPCSWPYTNWQTMFPWGFPLPGPSWSFSPYTNEKTKKKVQSAVRNRWRYFCDH